MKQVILRLQQQIDEVYALAGVSNPSHEFSKITVLLGSSRSGSSLLFHLLAESGAYFAPQGEESPFYRLAGQGWVTGQDQSDRIRVPVDGPVRNCARLQLLRDVGGEATSLLEPLYHAQCATRLLMQWAHLDLSPVTVFDLFKEESRRAGDAVELWLRVLMRLNLDVGFYDLPTARSRNLQLEAPDYFFEEPPFIIQYPRAQADSSRPLLLKSSSNIYRLPWLKTLFPEAEFRYVILARHPAASINGLIDGWLSNAFHSHNLQFVRPLKIRGYSEEIPFGDRWWKFDLPPEWSDFDDAPLAEVCAFQWRSAYSALSTVEEALTIRFEDLMASDQEVLNRIYSFSGTTPLRQIHLTQARPVMASQPPSTERWLLRKKEITPLLREARIRTLAEKLGYDFAMLKDTLNED